MNTPARGFTLIEILIVVVIIAVIATFATFSLGPREARMVKEEAERIAALLQLAEEESILSAQELALAVTETGYQFEVYDGADWQTLATDGVFRPRSLPESMQLAMTMDQKPVELPKAKSAAVDVTDKDEKKSEGKDSKDKDSKDKSDKGAKRDERTAGKSGKADKKAKDEPARALILSSGEVTPFELTVRLEDRDEGYKIAVDARGEIKLEKFDEKL